MEGEVEEVGDIAQPQDDSSIVMDPGRVNGVQMGRQEEQQQQAEGEEGKNVDTELEDLELSLQVYYTKKWLSLGNYIFVYCISDFWSDLDTHNT